MSESIKNSNFGSPFILPYSFLVNPRPNQLLPVNTITKAVYKISWRHDSSDFISTAMEMHKENMADLFLYQFRVTLVKTKEHKDTGRKMSHITVTTEYTESAYNFSVSSIVANQHLLY